LEREYYVMKNLEQDVGVIPHSNDISFEETEFKAKEGHVIELVVINRDLKRLPELIGDLQELRTLILDHNKLTELPISVSNLENLEFFSVYDNPINKPANFKNRAFIIQSILACKLGIIVEFINSYEFAEDFEIMIEEGLIEDPLDFMEIVYDKYWDTPPCENKELLIDFISALFRVFKNAKKYNKVDEVYAGDFFRIEILHRELLESAWKYLKYYLVKERWKFKISKEEEQKTYDYNGIPLNRDDYIAMMELEKMIGEPIPLYKEDPQFYYSYFYEEDGCFFHDICQFGFVPHNGHVIKLSLNCKNIEYIPESIGNLSQLIYLSLSHNFIRFLPTSIGKLSKLRFLEICFTELTQLPEEIGNLECLENLWIMDNNLNDLPDSIVKLKNLEYISILGNPPPFNMVKTLPKRIKKNLKMMDCIITGDDGENFFGNSD